MIELKLTEEQCQMAIKMAEEKVYRILEKGMRDIFETAATIKERGMKL